MRLRRVSGLVVACVLLGGVSVTATPAAVADTTGQTQNYVVLYKQTSVASDASATVRRAGGSVVYSYPQIGVVIARSDSTSFRSTLMKDSRIGGVAATTNFGSKLDGTVARGEQQSDGQNPGSLPGNSPTVDGTNPLFSYQWDMRQIHTPEAHAITGGSPSVIVGDIDTGLDWHHPDLRPNVDFSRSVSCLGGVPNTDPSAWDDVNGHGTHTAGTIAAVSNDQGIVGVAPNVKIAGIKAGNDDGFFFPEAVICAFVWAGTHQIDVTNNSYFADPYLYNCKNDPVQRAIWRAEQRAIKFAQQNGTLVVAAEGNEGDDLSHPTEDRTSPDDPPGTEQDRTIHNNCVVIPVELPGVVGVTSDSNTVQDGSAGQYPDHLKSFYSSYGISTADVVAPGGDSVFGSTDNLFPPFTANVSSRILSTLPRTDRLFVGGAPLPASRVIEDCGHREDGTGPCARYGWIQGTSMASPHVAGIAALIVSVVGRAGSPSRIAALLQSTADRQTCPNSLPGPNQFSGGASYEELGASVNNDAPPRCTGGPGNTSWYGAGEADAYNAVRAG